MHWKIKAAIQNAVSLLPTSFSYPAHFWIQRNFGGLRRVNPVDRLAAGIETWRRIKALGHDPSGKVFMEVGTGRVPVVPLAYWLMGAGKTIAIDLNPYLKAELIKENLQYISDNGEAIRKLFGSLLRQDRMDELLRFNSRAFSVGSFLDTCRIQYIAPGDASKTNLPDRSVDFHTSYTVFEHIPMTVLVDIINEGSRIITDSGVFVHRIDYSDHFSHSDRTISPINFLQYSDDEWNRYAGNRYMYVNRLRHDDYIDLLQSSGHRILAADAKVDEQSRRLLASGSLHVSERFKSKPEEVLSIKGAWIASQKVGGQIQCLG